MDPDTRRAIWESFKDRTVQFGYAATGIYTGLAASLPHFGEDLERGAIAAGVSAAAILASTLALQSEVFKSGMKKYRV